VLFVRYNPGTMRRSLDALRWGCSLLGRRSEEGLQNNHKTAKILDKMPKSVQGRAKQLIHEMRLSTEDAPTSRTQLLTYLIEVQPRMVVHLNTFSRPMNRILPKP
jgi:hypothetical protein